eukprot:1808900-Rhodomonas_salina.1
MRVARHSRIARQRSRCACSTRRRSSRTGSTGTEIAYEATSLRVVRKPALSVIGVGKLAWGQ